MANIFKNAWDNITGKNQEVEAGQASASTVNDTSDSVKSTKDLYNEGAEVASNQANNAAGVAGANAKANAIMNGGSKMAAALAGAKAAGDAATNTYNSQLQNAASTAQGQNELLSNIKAQKAQQDASNATSTANANASNKTSANTATASNKTNLWSSVVQGIGSLFK